MASDNGTDNLLRIVVIVLAIVFIGPMIMMALFFPLMGFGMMGGFGDRIFGPVWFLVIAVFWIVILGGGGYLVWRAFGGTQPSDDALEELRLSYARGELSDEEFEERRSRLKRE